jgi:hypothetical protein
MRRWKLGALLGLVLLLATGVLFRRPSAPPPIPLQDSHGIRRGMSYPEVLAIMGCPPDNYTTGEIKIPRNEITEHTENWNDHDARPELGETTMYQGTWLTDTAMFTVQFDASCKVICRNDCRVRKVTEDPVVNIVWRAER